MAFSIGGKPSEAEASTTPETKGDRTDVGSKQISPTRNPSKGGDFDVVKVSRIASIAIKTTGAPSGYSYRSSLGSGKKAFHKKKQSPKKAERDEEVSEEKETDSSVMTNEADEPKSTSTEKQNNSDASSIETPKDKPPTKSKVEKKTSPKKMSPKDKPARKRAIRELQESEDEDSSDEEAVPGNDPMEVITVSPYEGNANAEKGVKLFEDLYSLLTEGSIKASRIFGDVNARMMVKAFNQIDQSGMVYSQEWVDGVMRGNNVGVLPKDLLLLCLVSNRLIKVDEFLMAGLTRDLELIKIVKEAVEAWDMEDDFPKIAGTSLSLKNFTFSSKRRQCFKCEIFVARAFSAFKAFGSKGRLDKSLMAKVRKCMEIMEARVPNPKDKDGRKRKKSLEKPVVTEPVAAEIQEPIKEQLSPKRKRGRPPKKAEAEAEFEEPDDDSVMEEVVEDPAEITPPPIVARSSSSTKRSKQERSVNDIIAKFEQQYNEMGKIYEEMGKTLALLKSTVEEDKSNQEQVIRDEVRQEFMAEMQKRMTKK